MTSIKPPKCPKLPSKITNLHGDTFLDNYDWLKEKSNDQVSNYIQSENDHFYQSTSTLEPLQTVLYQEFISRINEQEIYPLINLSDGYFYYTKKIISSDYLLHCRKLIRNDDHEENEEIYLDENELFQMKQFKDFTYFKVGFMKLSNNFHILAYSIDLTGNEKYQVHFQNMITKEKLPNIIFDCYEDFEFSSNDQFVYYTILDDTCRSFACLRYDLISNDFVTLYKELDEMFYLTLSKSYDDQLLILNSSAQITSESSYLYSNSIITKFNLILPKTKNINYTVNHFNNFMYILTNENHGINRWIYRISMDFLDSNQDLLNEINQLSYNSKEYLDLYSNYYIQLKKNRQVIINHRNFVSIEEFQILSNHLILFERSNCLQNIRIISLIDFNNYYYIQFPDDLYSIFPGTFYELPEKFHDNTTINLRFTYTTLTKPKEIIDFNIISKSWKIIHQEEISNEFFNYDPNLYVSKRLYSLGKDGTTIPISICYRKDLLQPNTYCLLHSYGAYGVSSDLIFSSYRLSLLDRGFIYAIVHCRGGSEMGNIWYEDGKLLKKENTFNDFISAAEYLIQENYTSPSKLCIYGRSAGGLLIGSVLSSRPELFNAALLQVPFLDVINTMFDSSIPWTAFEYEEWGNPNDLDTYKIMKNYCPYSNITSSKADLYPNILITCGMNDPRVGYYEACKFVAKFRELIQNDKLVLLKVDEVGHGGNSGLNNYLMDMAMEYAFFISCLNAPVNPIYPAEFELEKKIDFKEKLKRFLNKKRKLLMKNININSNNSRDGSERNRFGQWLRNVF